MKTVIEMAREAGFAERDAMFRVAFVANKNNLERFAELVRADERALWELSRLGQEIEAQPERLWVGLTDEEVLKIIDAEIGFNSCWGPEEAFARAIEAKLKEKNNAV